MTDGSGKGPVFDQRGQKVKNQINVAGDYIAAPDPAQPSEPTANPDDHVYRVFVSSTYLDNQERRKVVEDAILRAEMLPIGMERFTADERPAVDACLDFVKEADVLVGILAWRYGWIPEGRTFSITELEYDAASQRLMFLLDDSQSVDPGNDFDEGPDRWEKQQKLESFKNRVTRDQMPAKFIESNLGTIVFQALVGWRDRKRAQVRGAKPRHKPPDPVTAPAVPSFDSEIQDYQTKLDSFYASLPAAGFARQIKVPVDIQDLYIPLRAMMDPGGEARPDFDDAEHAARSLGGHERHVDIDLPGAFEQAEQIGRRGTVILGDPGSGKTTHLLRLLLWCVREGPGRLGLPADMVPVFLPLRNLRDLNQGMDAFIQHELARPALRTTEGFGLRLMERGGLLFLLDGLDEVADQTRRKEVSEWIGEEARVNSGCRFVVTCRYAGYTKDVALNEHFLEMHIRPFTGEQAEEFVQKWYLLVEKGVSPDPDQATINAAERADDLIECLRTPDFRARRVFELTRNPLLLTNICLVHRHRNRLPQKRAQLYEDCVNVLLEHWQEAKKLKWEIDARKGRRVLQPAAYWLHSEDERTRATAEELAPVIEPALAAIEWNGDARSFLEQIRNHSGLLTGWDHKHYGFMHLGFQEYLAAREIRGRAIEHPEVLSELAAHFGESWWQEVGLLLLSLEDPSLFVPYMREVVKLPNFADHPGLVEACLDDAEEISSVPFIELLKQGPGRESELWQRQLLALNIVERIDPQALEKLAESLRKHPSAEIRNRFISREDEMTREILEAERGGYELVPIPGGTFLMGSPDAEYGRYDDEIRHEVTVSSFTMGRYPVTNEEYAVFLKENPGVDEPEYWGDRNFNQARQPVVGVGWEEARRYAKWAGLRLPTEAEWEYACRAGTESAFNDGSDCTDPEGLNTALDKLGWFNKNSGLALHPVGEKLPNRFGLYDMHGNIWEWCEDHAELDDDVVTNTYVNGITDPLCREGARRVVRGGGFLGNARDCRSACRDADEPGNRYQILGFRLAAGQQTGSGAGGPAAEGAAAPGSREATSADGPTAERSHG